MTDLDDAYANAAYIPGAADYPPRWARAAEGLREGLLEQGLADLDLSYGDSARQRLDLFYPGADGLRAWRILAAVRQKHLVASGSRRTVTGVGGCHALL